jgi:hypothetical protein
MRVEFLPNLSIQHRPTTRAFSLNPQLWQKERAPDLWANHPRLFPVHRNMDELSNAASVMAVLQNRPVYQLSLKDYYEGVRDAREDIQKLYDTIKSFESILPSIREIINGRNG